MSHGTATAWQIFGPTQPANRSRLLLLSYHFPPGNATGALRWQKLSGVAMERGFSLDVVTVAPTAPEAADSHRLAELPPDTRIFGVPGGLPFIEKAVAGLARVVKRRGLNSGTGSPAAVETSSAEADAGIVYPWQITRRDALGLVGLRRSFNAWRSVSADDPWSRSAAALAEKIADPGVHRFVISCGPPHGAHDAALRVSAKTRIPLVLDLRDPWGLAQAVSRSRASPLFFSLRRRRERRSVKAARLVVVNSETHQIALKAVYPEAADRIECVMNGYDPELYRVDASSGRFTIAYAGNIYLDRDPRPLFNAAACVIRKLGLRPDQFAIEMMGSVEHFGDRRTIDLARAFGIEEYVHLHPRRSRQEALAFLQSATMLLSLPQDLDLSVPSKIFDYFQFEAWLLALAERVSGTAILLRGTGADVVSPRDEAGIAAAIERRYTEFASGIRPRALAHDNPGLARRAQAEKLFDLLSAISCETLREGTKEQ